MCWFSSNELEFGTKMVKRKRNTFEETHLLHGVPAGNARNRRGKGKRRATETRRELTHRSPSSSPPPPDPDKQKLNKAQNLLQMTSLN